MTVEKQPSCLPVCQSQQITQTELTDELLLARYWQLDVSTDQMRQIDALIAANPGVLARWERLRADLNALKQPPISTAPAAVLQRLQQSLRLRAEPVNSYPQWPKFVATFAAGAAAAVMLWVHPPQRSSKSQTPEAVSTSASIASMSPLNFQAVRLHISETQDLLRGLDPSNREQRRLLADVIAQNQGFQRRAKQQGRSDLARLLGALEPVLIELARADQDSSNSGLVEQFEFESQALLTNL